MIRLFWQGRWPKKSATFLLELLRNAISNAEYVGLNCERLYVSHIQVNPAHTIHRRTFRAHGRVTPYNRHLSHIHIVLAEKEK